MVMIIIGVVLLAIGVGLVFGKRSQKDKVLEIKATRTSPAAELNELAASVRESLGQPGGFCQVAEVKGQVKCEPPLVSEMGKQPCAYYSCQVTRRYEETYWETDSNTRQRVQKTRSGEETVSSNSQRTPFYIEDATGRVKVNPEGITPDTIKTVDRFEPGEPPAGGEIRFGSFTLSLGLGAVAAGRRTLGYHFEEHVLPVNRPAYVLGEASDTTGEVVIGKPKEKGRKFIISLKSEDELIRSAESAAKGFYWAALIVGGLGAILIVAGILSKLF